MGSAQDKTRGGSLKRAEGSVGPGYAEMWISGECRVVWWCCIVSYDAAPGNECGEQLQTTTSCPVLSVLGERGRGTRRGRVPVKSGL